MNVGITAWGNRISPVFDSAQTLLVAEIIDKEVGEIVVRSIQPMLFDQFLDLLDALEVEVLICGALCRAVAARLQANNIQLISFVTGEVEKVLQHYAADRDLEAFVMPGCGQTRCYRTGKVVQGDHIKDNA